MFASPAALTIINGGTASNELELGRSARLLIQAPGTLTGTVKLETIVSRLASLVRGSGANGTLTVYATELGPADGAYTLEIKVASGNNKPLSATIASGVIVVNLGTGGGGAVDNAKNTTALLAGVLNALPGVKAIYSGTGATAFTGTVAVANLTGGRDYVPLQDPIGTDITLAAGKAVMVELWAGKLRVNSGSAEGAARVFWITAIGR